MTADRIDCAEQCEIPPGITITEVPPSRHAWADVFRCPNDGCEKTFLARPAEEPQP